MFKMKNKSRIVLSRQELFKMIDLWGEYIEQFREKYRNKDIYKVMSLEFRKRYRLTLTSSGFRTRVNNLKKRFRIERKSVLSGRGASTWPYYQKLEQILVKENPNTSEKSYANDDDLDSTKPSVEESFPIPKQLEDVKEEEDTASGSIKTRHKRKRYEDEFLRIAKEEKQNMENYFKHSLKNDEKIIKLLQNNSILLSQFLNKA